MTAPRDRESYLQGRIDAFEEAAKTARQIADDAWDKADDPSEAVSTREYGRMDGALRVEDGIRATATAARAELAAATEGETK